MTYFFNATPASVDVDNIIKPIADALCGVTYVDDSQMQRVTSRRVDTAGASVVAVATPAVIAALASTADFVHVRVAQV